MSSLTPSRKPQKTNNTSLVSLLTRIVVLMLFDGMASLFIWLLMSDGFWQLALMMGVITLFVNIVFLREDGYPLRWMAPGLSFMLLLSVYPIIFSIYIAFTNFGSGHLLPKVQALDVLAQRTFLPEDGVEYEYTLFQDGAGNFALWLVGEDGTGSLASVGGRATAAELGIASVDESGVPETITGYGKLDRVGVVKSLTEIDGVEFGEPPNVVQVTATLGRAAELESRYVYDEAEDAVLDRQSGLLYYANAQSGQFVAESGEELFPGYQTNVGANNFRRFLTNPAFRGPLVQIFVWTFMFALLSVFFSFALGLLIAIAFGRDMPFRTLIKAGLIIPWAIPNVITVLVWKGLFNPLNGVISNGLAAVFNQPIGWPPVFADPLWVKVALIVINVWLAFPYFMLINSGALQAIPQDIFEAADLDGANGWQRFRFLTLPLLLVGVGPLLIASFTANFNSFNVIFLFNGGGPPMANTSTPAGHSDILISYVYRLAFQGSSQDFGYASAITMIIFVVMLVATLVQFRYMRIWEEIGEGV